MDDFSEDFGGIIQSFPEIGLNIMFKILERENAIEGWQANNAVRKFGKNSERGRLWPEHTDNDGIKEWGRFTNQA